MRSKDIQAHIKIVINWKFVGKILELYSSFLIYAVKSNII